MAIFLTNTNTPSKEKRLSDKIMRILSGEKVRIASAFLGSGCQDIIPEGTKLICDIGMGGTSPMALGKLREKLGKRLRWRSRFHIKMYISSLGAVVGSANLSNNGIGFLDDSGLDEAGIFLEPKSEAYKETVDYFELIWKDTKNTKIVDLEAIERARRTWAASKQGIPENHGSANDFWTALQKEEHDVFNDWEFILTFNEHNGEIKNVAESTQKEKFPDESMEFFSELKPKECPNGSFISIHRGSRGKVYISAGHPIYNDYVMKDSNSDVLISYYRKIDWENSGLPPRKKYGRDSDLGKILSKWQKNYKKNNIGNSTTFLKMLKKIDI